ncbi:FolC bifunctional protein [Wilcoxina mikolae CBS 423.85]|nr:FolC bifunctional protein [Wilcoxina mikolae CBS 423.85]
MSTGKTYNDAVAALNTLQTPFDKLEARRQAGLKMESSALLQMKEWIRRIGYQMSDLNRLNIVHVAGTKGKGSTCAFVNSILCRYQRSHGAPTKVALYTSPHLIAVRERLLINKQAISEELFAKYFFEVWERLEASAIAEGLDPSYKPVYFRFLTLMSFHVFLEEGVDVAVYEVGVGGELDSTNVVEAPAATGITLLGIDHTVVLGDTIDKIAWHKAGIFKAGSSAFTVPQVPDAMAVVEQRAEEKGVKLEKVNHHPEINAVNFKSGASFQRMNASLAIHLAAAVLERFGYTYSDIAEKLPPGFVQGLNEVEWRGRCELKVEDATEWYLDGAHTYDSLKVAVEWFAEMVENRKTRCGGNFSAPTALIFNQQSRPEVLGLLKALHENLRTSLGEQTSFDRVVFCTNVTWKDKGYGNDLVDLNNDPQVVQNLQVQRSMADMWKTLDNHAQLHVMDTIEDAVNFGRELGTADNKAMVFVTGSLRLVGGVLTVQETTSS